MSYLSLTVPLNFEAFIIQNRKIMLETLDQNLETYGIKDAVVHWNLTSEELQKITLAKGMGRETSNGTLAINTGKFTGRSPKDRFLVKDDYTKDRVWWGRINKPISSENFEKLQEEIINYLSGKELYARDGYVCAHPEYRMNIRTITEYPWSNLFINSMFLRPNHLIEGDWALGTCG